MYQTLTNTAKMRAIRVKAANKHIFHALLTLVSAALLSRMFGALNQLIVTSRFGAGEIMDAYFVAYLVPSFIARLLGSAMEASVIPVYTRVRSQGNKEQISRLFSTVLNLCLASTILLTIIMLLFRQQLIFLSAPGLDHARLALAASLAPLLYPVVVLTTMVGLLECIFNAEGQFGWPAYAGLLVPLTTAVFVLLMGNSRGVVMLCVGMLSGLCLQLCVFIVRVRRAKLVYRPVMDLSIPEMRAIFTAAWPALLGFIIGQGSPFIDQIFASSLSSGSISALNYSLKIIAVFSGVIFASVARAVLPYLSQSVTQKDMKAFKEMLRLYWWIVGVSTAILSALVIVFAHPIVQILFQRGAFSSADTNRTAAALMGFAIGLTPMSLGFITARAFSALGKTKVFIGVGIFTVLADAFFDYTFAHFWQSQGIALATSAVYCCTMIINFFVLSRMIGKLNLLAPPIEVIQVMNRLKFSLLRFFRDQKKHMLYIIFALLVFAAGLVGGVLDATYTLRVALGSVFIVVLLRYRYALLIAWVTLDAFIGSTMPYFKGNHLDTVLTVSTLLLMLFIPINDVFKRMPALIFLLLYLLWVFAGIGITTIGIGSFLAIWLLRLDCLAVVVLTVHVLSTPRRLHLVSDIIIVVVSFIGLYGIYGYITRHNGMFDPTTSLFRIYSIYSSAPPLALFFSIVIPLAIYRMFMLRGLKRVAMALLLLILLIATILTFARGAFICVPLSVGIFILFLPSRKMKIALLSAMVGLIMSIIGLSNIFDIPILSRFFNQDILTFNERTYLWQALLSHFHPEQLLGNGLNASNVLLTNLYGGLIVATAPSNLYIGTLYDHGIVGLGLLILTFVTLFITVIRGILKTRGEQRLLFVVALSILVSVLFQSLEVDDFWKQAIGLYFWVIIAFPFALCWSRQEGISDELMDEKMARETRDVPERVTIPEMEAISL